MCTKQYLQYIALCQSIYIYISKFFTSLNNKKRHYKQDRFLNSCLHDSIFSDKIEKFSIKILCLLFLPKNYKR